MALLIRSRRRSGAEGPRVLADPDLPRPRPGERLQQLGRGVLAALAAGRPPRSGVRIATVATAALGTVHLGWCRRRHSVRALPRLRHVPRWRRQGQVAQEDFGPPHDFLHGHFSPSRHGELALI